MAIIPNSIRAAYSRVALRWQVQLLFFEAVWRLETRVYMRARSFWSVFAGRLRFVDVLLLRSTHTLLRPKDYRGRCSVFGRTPAPSRKSLRAQYVIVQRRWRLVGSIVFPVCAVRRLSSGFPVSASGCVHCLPELLRPCHLVLVRV